MNREKNYGLRYLRIEYLALILSIVAIWATFQQKNNQQGILPIIGEAFI
jgi:hypothetical protein